MGCFVTNSKCDDRLELAKIDTARKDLKIERKALEAEKVEFKVKMKMEEEEFQRTIEKSAPTHCYHLTSSVRAVVEG